jgi:hypothetical protein
MIEIIIDRNNLHGTVNLVAGDEVLAARSLRPDLAPDPGLPADTRIWALLQNASGGTWGGCVYDVNAIAAKLS